MCGKATVVVINNGKASLLCFAHTKQEAAFFPLPKDRPTHWPNLTNEEMVALVDAGHEYHEENFDANE